MSQITTDNFGFPASVSLAAPAAATPTAITVNAAPAQASSDDMLIDLWLHGRCRHTRRVYRGDSNRFLAYTRKPLIETRLADLQSFSDSLVATGLAPVSSNRIIAVVKSLFAFGHRLGYFPFDVAKPLRISAVRDTLSERILDEPDIQRLIALESHPRNHLVLLIAYASGTRVSELSGLRWIDCVQRENGAGQITVFGKRGRTRAIRLPASVFTKLQASRPPGSADDAPVFLSRRNRALSSSQILRIVKCAAKRAGIKRNVSPHWLRHGHASHSLDRGAPISLVQATLGHVSVATTSRYLHARPGESSATFLPL